MEIGVSGFPFWLRRRGSGVVICVLSEIGYYKRLNSGEKHDLVVKSLFYVTIFEWQSNEWGQEFFFSEEARFGVLPEIGV